MPPSIGRTAPVIYPFSTRNYHACAISSGLPNLFIGADYAMASTAYSVVLFVIGVQIIPGARALTLIPFIARSRAIGSVSPRMAPLLAP